MPFLITNRAVSINRKACCQHPHILTHSQRSVFRSPRSCRTIFSFHVRQANDVITVYFSFFLDVLRVRIRHVIELSQRTNFNIFNELRKTGLQKFQILHFLTVKKQNFCRFKLKQNMFAEFIVKFAQRINELVASQKFQCYKSRNVR